MFISPWNINVSKILLSKINLCRLTYFVMNLDIRLYYCKGWLKMQTQWWPPKYIIAVLYSIEVIIAISVDVIELK